MLIDPEDVYRHYPVLDFNTMMKQKKGVRRVSSITVRTSRLSKPIILKKPQEIAEFLAPNLMKRGNCMLAFEELGGTFPKSSIRLMDLCESMGEIITRGRKQGVGFLGIAQRPQHLHTEFLAQANHIISYEVSSKHDKDAMSYYIDKEKYDDLKRFEFFHYNTTENYLKKCYKLYQDDLYHSLDYYKKMFGEA